MPENSATTHDLDLFGKPVLPIKDRRGRPSYAVSKENQEVVTVLRAANWNHERIAGILGCDEKTLRKHFSRELEVGADIVEAEALMVNYRKMRMGNNAATGRVLEMAERKQLEHPQKKPAAATKPERARKLGKKEQQAADAQVGHQGNEWGNLLQ